MSNYNQADFGTNYGADAPTTTTPIILGTPASIPTTGIAAIWANNKTLISIGLIVIAYAAIKHFKK